MVKQLINRQQTKIYLCINYPDWPQIQFVATLREISQNNLMVTYILCVTHFVFEEILFFNGKPCNYIIISKDYF